MTDYTLCPFSVAIDTREQHPYAFTGYRADADKKYKPLIIPTEVITLHTGDYSIVGMQNRIAVERKSIEDAFSTFCHHRERFERELARLNQMEFAAVVVEASWNTILTCPPPHTKFSPKSFFRSVTAWEIRFPRVHWRMCETRFLAEHTTFRWLQRFWDDEQERKKQERLMEKSA
jgi:DNA excision repair protein ERCC-4